MAIFAIYMLANLNSLLNLDYAVYQCNGHNSQKYRRIIYRRKFKYFVYMYK